MGRPLEEPGRVRRLPGDLLEKHPGMSTSWTWTVAPPSKAGGVTARHEIMTWNRRLQGRLAGVSMRLHLAWGPGNSGKFRHDQISNLVITACDFWSRCSRSEARMRAGTGGLLPASGQMTLCRRVACGLRDGPGSCSQTSISRPSVGRGRGEKEEGREGPVLVL